MFIRLKEFIARETGQGNAEFAFILALIAIACIAGAITFISGSYG